MKERCYDIGKSVWLFHFLNWNLGLLVEFLHLKNEELAHEFSKVTSSSKPLGNELEYNLHILLTIYFEMAMSQAMLISH